MKDKYEYSVEELKFIVNELIAWRDGLELQGGMFSEVFLTRIDRMLELKKFEDEPAIAMKPPGKTIWPDWFHR